MSSIKLRKNTFYRERCTSGMCEKFINSRGFNGGKVVVYIYIMKKEAQMKYISQTIFSRRELDKNFKYGSFVSYSQSLHHQVKITHKNTEVFVR